HRVLHSFPTRRSSDLGAMLLPIDSEHNAIFQCLPPFASGELVAKGIRRILLTGSGGPFRSRSRAELHRVTPDEACAHPNWVMGRDRKSTRLNSSHVAI